MPVQTSPVDKQGNEPGIHAQHLANVHFLRSVAERPGGKPGATGASVTGRPEAARLDFTAGTGGLPQAVRTGAMWELQEMLKGWTDLARELTVLLGRISIVARSAIATYEMLVNGFNR
jgi:hypothetical protein